MWIKDHYERLINSDNVRHFSVTDVNSGKKNTNPSWVVAARILKTDCETCSSACLTERFKDKEEAVMRFDAIAEGLRNDEVFLELE